MRELTQFSEKAKKSRQNGKIENIILDKLLLTLEAIGVLVSSFDRKEQSRHVLCMSATMGGGAWANKLVSNFETLNINHKKILNFQEIM